VEKRKHLKISKDIKYLNTDSLSDNLFYYSYHTRHLLSLIAKKEDEESPQFISAFNGFRGELFENVVYELLLQYALNNDEITQFVLKGPHQEHSNKDNKKFGLLMDKSKQIVYKAGYKDVSEYDAMFFTKDSVYYVESTIVQSTIGLRKRLRKKTALLSLLFPKLKIKALIILSEGATGLNRFPSNATVWVTKQLNPKSVLEKLALGKKYKRKPFIKYDSSKLIEAHDIEVKIFKYFDTLGWILRKAINPKENSINKSFFFGKNVVGYLDIYSKVYIGYLSKETLELLLNDMEYSNLNLNKIENDKHIFVTLDKGDDGSFDIVYYVKEGRVLKKIEFINDKVKVSDKDPKGFTVAETKYMRHNLKQKNKLELETVLNITSDVKTWS
jgi:peroxiredoxin family protein